ncbi:MAG: DUF3822 family protein [Ginsengibacter sp.]
MKAVFEILPGSVDAGKCVLICEISNEGFSYAIKNEEQNMYTGVAMYYFNKGTESKEYGNILQDLISAQTLFSDIFKKVYIMYSVTESVLIPFTLYSSLENENVLKLIHGDKQNNTSLLTDLIVENGIYNVYRVPASMVNAFRSKFGETVNIHQYSVLLKQPALPTNKLFVIFYPQKMVVRLVKNNRNEFINSFYYDTVEDVSYILLNIRTQYEVDNIPVELGGLIEKDSALFKEIYKYFEPVDFAALPLPNNYSEEITRQPSHYFSHIFAIDSCE